MVKTGDFMYAGIYEYIFILFVTMRQRHGNAMKFSYITRIGLPAVPLEFTSKIT